MKKLMWSIIISCSCLSVMSQQALWGGQNITSPEIHINQTVTFRFHAPKAVQVQIIGDFLPTQKTDIPYGETGAPGMMNLIEGENGIWEYTT